MQLLTTNISFESENAITKMVEDLHEVIALLNRVHVDDSRLVELQHELSVLNLFSNRQIVSIAGLQSVGKTSLIKRYLDLPDDVLLSEVGVGEKRPVLISARKDVSEVCFYCVKSQKRATGYNEIVTEKISKNDLNNRVQHPALEDLWYEIIVPKNDRIGVLTLALLPGFERNKQSDSQKFLDLFLNCSTGMILVLNHMRLAQAVQHELLEQVSKVYKDKTPGFVLTFANELEEGKKETIVGNLMKQFQIDQDSQILYSDDDIADVPQKLEKLIKQNSRYSISSANLHTKKQLLIGEQLAMELMKIENNLKAKHFKEENDTSFRFDKRQFNTFREEYMRIVRNVLESHMNQHIAQCQQVVVDQLGNESSTLMGKFKGFFKNELTYEETEGLKEWVKNIYMTEDPYKTNHLLIDSIGLATESYLNKHIDIVTVQIEQQQKQLQQNKQPILEKEQHFSIESKEVSEFGSVDWKDGSSEFGDVVFMKSTSEFGGFSNEFMPVVSEPIQTVSVGDVNGLQQEEGQPQNSKVEFAVTHTLTKMDEYLNLKQDNFYALSDAEFTVLPAIAGSIAQQALATKTAMDRHAVSNDSISNISYFENQISGFEGIKNEINNLSMDMDNIIKGTAIFFGIDALDGTFNSFGAIVGALEAIGLAGSAATIAAGGGVAGVAAAIAIKKGGEKIEKFKFQRDDYAKNMLRVAGDYQIEATIETINKVFDDIDYRLDMVSSYRKNENSNSAIYSELQIRMNRLSKECGKLRELAFRNETFINKISPTTI